MGSMLGEGARSSRAGVVALFDAARGDLDADIIFLQPFWVKFDP
jgi:hypothetical protein